MDEELYKVLVQVDDASRVTAINSDAFISDETGWTVVDVGTGDRHHHAQNNYLTYPLIDDRGVYCYKFVDGMVVQRTQTEMDTDYANQPDPEPSKEEKEKTLTNARIQALTDRNEFIEDCIAEMAAVIYA